MRTKRRSIGRRTTAGRGQFRNVASAGGRIINRMRRLSSASEYLDGALSDRATLVGNLRDLRRVNAIFGGAELSLRAMRGLIDGDARLAAAHPDSLRVLDVGTGAADIPTRMLHARGPWRAIHVTAVDSRPEVIEAALVLEPSLAREPNLSLAVADGRSLPYPDGAFDVAHASLVLHHLEPDNAVAFLRELRRVVGLGVVINDLERGRLGWLAAWLLLHALTRNRFTLHDGPLSVRRAYRRGEARDLLAAAGLRPVREVVGIAGHRWAIAAMPR
jgi:SAM-dependent methyltransferase